MSNTTMNRFKIIEMFPPPNFPDIDIIRDNNIIPEKNTNIIFTKQLINLLIHLPPK